MHTENGCRGDTILGLGPNYKEIQQDLTELNGDGNRERGRDGESIVSFIEEDDGQPSTYEEYQDVFGGDDWDHGQYD